MRATAVLVLFLSMVPGDWMRAHPLVAGTPAQAYVLSFDGSPQTVDGGDFWPANTPLGPFYWVARVRPEGSGYIVSDGFGGAHALLFGVSTTDRTSFVIHGNVWNGTALTSFASSPIAKLGEWGEIAVSWDGHAITTYYDEKPLGTTAFAGPRISVGFPGGGGRVLVGGSDHLNFHGQIAWVKGFEDRSAPVGEPNLFYDFSEARAVVRDQSSGYRGRAHPARLRGVARLVLVECAACPWPRFVAR